MKSLNILVALSLTLVTAAAAAQDARIRSVARNSGGAMKSVDGKTLLLVEGRVFRIKSAKSGEWTVDPDFNQMVRVVEIRKGARKIVEHLLLTYTNSTVDRDRILEVSNALFIEGRGVTCYANSSKANSSKDGFTCELLQFENGMTIGPGRPRSRARITVTNANISNLSRPSKNQLILNDKVVANHFSKELQISNAIKNQLPGFEKHLNLVEIKMPVPKD